MNAPEFNRIKPHQILREFFLLRRGENPLYSLRAFARDLGMSPTLLSFILNEKRPLTIEQAARIAILLDLDSEEKERLHSSVLKHWVSGARPKDKEITAKLSQRKSEWFSYEADLLAAVSEWQHLAILDLTAIRDFKPDPVWIAKKLRISIVDVSASLDRLLRLGLLEKRGKRLVKAQARITFPNQRAQAGARAYHRSILNRILQELNRDSDADFARRKITGVTLAINPKKLNVAIDKIEKFKKEMTDLLSPGALEEVYHLELAFIPLTEKKEASS